MQKKEKKRKLFQLKEKKLSLKIIHIHFFENVEERVSRLVCKKKKTSSFYLFGSVANEFEFILYIQVNKKKKSMRMMMMMMVFFLTLNN